MGTRCSGPIEPYGWVGSGDGSNPSGLEDRDRDRKAQIGAEGLGEGGEAGRVEHSTPGKRLGTCLAGKRR